MLKKSAALVLVILGAYLAVKYLLPLTTPFLLGALLAALAEPAVRVLAGRLRLRRSFASAIGVSASLALLVGAALALLSVAYREIQLLMDRFPDLVETAQISLNQIQSTVTNLADSAPVSLRPLLMGTVKRSFSSSSAVLEKLASSALELAGHIIGGSPGSALFLGTAVLSGYMLSSQGPALLEHLRRRLPPAWKTTWKPALLRTRRAVWGWLRAQAILCSLTWLLVGSGLMLLRVRFGFLWALPIALLDALPMVGTGIVLVPWALVWLLQNQPIRALGLLGVMVAAMLLRSVLEPRLVGKQLGLNPLLTLIAMYAGFRLWGVIGMVLSPILAVVTKQTADCFFPEKEV